MKIGIIGAMEIEVAALKEEMQVTRTVTKAGMTFVEGQLCGKEVVVVRSGIGKVNAGICVQILVDDFGVSHVVNTGVAGSLDARIDIADIVLSTDTLYHDMDATGFGYPLGQIPQMDVFSFEADKTLREIAKEACLKVNPDVHVFEGRIVSGDQFINTNDVKKKIVENFHGLCTEMEGAAISHAAFLNNIPFLIIRAISDKADDSAQMDYPTFEKKAADCSVRLMEELLRRL